MNACILSHDGNVTAVAFHREKSDADYIRDRVEQLLGVWGVSALRIRAAQRKALNMRRDYRDLSNDQCIWRVVAANKPDGDRA